MTTINKSLQGLEIAVNAFIVLNTQNFGSSVFSVYPGINSFIHFILKWGFLGALVIDGGFFVYAVRRDKKSGHRLPRNTLITLANIAGSIVGSRCIGLDAGTSLGLAVGSSFTQSAAILATCTSVGSVIGILVGAVVIGNICGSMMAAICDDIKDARNGESRWNVATAVIKLTCKWTGCLGGGYGSALLVAAIGGAIIGIVGRISGGAVGAIIGAALGYFGGRYAGDRLKEFAKKFLNGVKQIPTAVRRFPESSSACGMQSAVAFPSPLPTPRETNPSTSSFTSVPVIHAVLESYVT